MLLKVLIEDVSKQFEIQKMVGCLEEKITNIAINYEKK